MSSKVTVERAVFAERLSIVGRAVMPRASLPVLSNVLLRSDQGRLQLSVTDLTLGVTTWVEDISIDGELALTLPAKTLSDVVNSLSDPSVVFSANGKPEIALKSGGFKGVIKGTEALEFPEIPVYDVSDGISLNIQLLKEMIRSVVFAASTDNQRPVLNGVLLSIEDRGITLAATDGFRISVHRAALPVNTGKKQLIIIPASVLKDALRILPTVKDEQVVLFTPDSGTQVVMRCEDIQIVSQLVDGSYPDYQAVIPGEFRTRSVLETVELVKACKQAAIIAREGTNVIHLHLLPPCGELPGRLRIQAQSEEAGASEIELPAAVEGEELEIAFNVRFLLDALEVMTTPSVVLETNLNNTPAVIRPVGMEDYLYVLMPMHVG